MRIGIIGSAGRMGIVLSSILRNRNEIISCDDESCDNSVIDQADLTFLCIPLNDTKKILSESGMKANLVEIGSVKSPLSNFAGHIISIHPLFGPMTFNNDNYRNIIFIDDLSINGSKRIIENLFKGFRIISMTSKEHDLLMSRQLVLPYLISMISKIEDDSEALTFSRSLLDNIISIQLNESEEVFRDTIFLNPYSKEMVNEISSKISELKEMLQ
jgi:prephenate dehydrogenase/chorismate mutase/prephenate dehydrogenase